MLELEPVLGLTPWKFLGEKRQAINFKKIYSSYHSQSTKHQPNNAHWHSVSFSQSQMTRFFCHSCLLGLLSILCAYIHCTCIQSESKIKYPKMSFFFLESLAKPYQNIIHYSKQGGEKNFFSPPCSKARVIGFQKNFEFFSFVQQINININFTKVPQFCLCTRFYWFGNWSAKKFQNQFTMTCLSKIIEKYIQWKDHTFVQLGCIKVKG